MSRTYFGTDGIRGTVGQAPITADFMLRLGHAVGRVLRASEARPTVLIGKSNFDIYQMRFVLTPQFFRNKIHAAFWTLAWNIFDYFRMHRACILFFHRL